MSQQADAGMDAPKSLREYIVNTAINTIPPLIAYYVLRVFDFEPYLALVGAIITAAVQGALGSVLGEDVTKTVFAQGLALDGAVSLWQP